MLKNLAAAIFNFLYVGSRSALDPQHWSQRVPYSFSWSMINKSLRKTGLKQVLPKNLTPSTSCQLPVPFTRPPIMQNGTFMARNNTRVPKVLYYIPVAKKYDKFAV